MKGFKGFSPGMICRGKQYAENTEFEEEKATICQEGMHFCESPLDVFRFYPPTDEHGNLNEFAEVKAEDAKTDDGIKFVTKKLKIGAKLSLSEFVNAGVEFLLEKQEGKPATNTGYRSAATNTGYRSAATNTGDCSAATNTGDCSAATNTGNWSAATNTGYRSAATNTGYWSAATNTGDCSAATNTGDCSAATNTGNCSAATNTGNCSAASNTGNWSAATNTGDWSAATNTGDCSAATNTGDWSAATNTGDCSAATNTGDCSAASVKGEESIAIVTGRNSKAKGALNDWLVLTERDDNWKILGIKAVMVDGEKIKADTWYRLSDGEIKEAAD